MERIDVRSKDFIIGGRISRKEILNPLVYFWEERGVRDPFVNIYDAIGRMLGKSNG